jgi:hypothetical protein
MPKLYMEITPGSAQQHGQPAPLFTFYLFIYLFLNIDAMGFLSQ